MSKRRLKNSARKGMVMKLFIGLYLVSCLFGIISLRTAVFSMEYELGDLDMLRADLTSERKMVMAERASYYSTGKIENIAVRRLGMTLSGRDNVFYVKRTAAAGPYRASLR